MYDKVKLFCPRTGTTPDISQYLEHPREHTDLITKEVMHSGDIEGLVVYSSPRGTTIYGSLAKFLYGHNLFTLDLNSTRQVFEKVSDLLHLDLSYATLSEIEFGTNLIMRKPDVAYLLKLGEMPKMTREPCGKSTLYYKTASDYPSKKCVFYDKGKEMRKKKEKNILAGYGLLGANVLRYEVRFNGRLSHQLKVPDVLVPTLLDRGFYEMMVDVWRNDYFSIEKRRLLAMPMTSEKASTAKDLYNLIAGRCFYELGEEYVKAQIDVAKANNVCKNRADYTRTAKWVKHAKSLAESCTDDEDIIELDDAIRNASAYM